MAGDRLDELDVGACGDDELVRACGFELPLELVPHDPTQHERLRKTALLSPERRIQRLLQARRKGARGP